MRLRIARANLVAARKACMESLVPCGSLNSLYDSTAKQKAEYLHDSSWKGIYGRELLKCIC